MKKTVAVDFDGVIHSYASGWKGATNIPDPPVPGAIKFLQELSEEYEVAILSTRAESFEAEAAIRAWLLRWGLPESVIAQITVTNRKVPSILYIDDRGWRFEGTFPDVSEIAGLKPWNKS